MPAETSSCIENKTQAVPHTLTPALTAPAPVLRSPRKYSSYMSLIPHHFLSIRPVCCVCARACEHVVGPFVGSGSTVLPTLPTPGLELRLPAAMLFL